MSRRRIGTIGFLLVLLLVVYFLGKQFLDLQQLANMEAELRGAVKQHWWLAFAIGFLVYTVTSLVPGTMGKSLVFAWLFGFFAGILMVNLALTAAAILAFLISRYALHDTLQKKFGAKLAGMNDGLEKSGAKYVLWLRLFHAPYTFVNYALGTTSLRTRTFWWTTQLGILPGNLVFVYAGSRLPSLQKLVDDGAGSLFSTEMIVAFVALSLLPLIIHRIAKRPESPA